MLDFHESSFSTKEYWADLSRENTAFSPESIAKAILSNDAMKIISRAIRGEHEFKANIEALTDKVYDVIRNGLDNSIPGWNENKAAEFEKYIKAQKRASRKQKRATQKTAEAAQPTSDAPASLVESEKKVA